MNVETKKTEKITKKSVTSTKKKTVNHKKTGISPHWTFLLFKVDWYMKSALAIDLRLYDACYAMLWVGNWRMLSVRLHCTVLKEIEQKFKKSCKKVYSSEKCWGNGECDCLYLVQYGFI